MLQTLRKINSQMPSIPPKNISLQRTVNQNGLKILYIAKLLLVLLLLIPSNSQFCPEAVYMYSEFSTTSCQPCLYYCQTCVSSTQCQNCKSEYYQFPEFSGQCVPCGYGCQVCNNSTDCVTCQTGLYLDDNGKCLSCDIGVKSCTLAIIQSCSSGYFRLNEICAGCLQNCASCNDFVTCNTCKDRFFLVAGSGNSADTCQSCSSNCLVCSSASVCVSCERGFKVHSNSSCVQLSCSSFNNFCTKCTSSSCTECKQGFYLQSGNCKQGGSLLCLQSFGVSHIHCQTSKYGCPSYAQTKTNSNNVTLDVCLPKHYTIYSEYTYQKTNDTSIVCSSTTCTISPSSITLTRSSQPYYQVKYYLSLRLYSAIIHNVLVTQKNSSVGSAAAHSSINISNHLALGNQGCAGCPFGQVIIEGTLVVSGHGTTQFQISDSSSTFVLMESVFQFQLCKVSYCESCTTAIDCLRCQSPYFLQLIKCVSVCDPGFYSYIDSTLNIRSCVLTCPTGTFSTQSTYTCTTCQSPCSACSALNQCLTCAFGFFLQGTQCLTQCSTTTLFANSTTLKCQQCPNPCTTCQKNPSNSSQVQCLTCDIGYLLQDDFSCTYICPSETFSSFNSFGNSICDSCHASCTDCYLGTEICSGCKDGFLLYDYTTCNKTNVCLPGFYIVNQSTVLSTGVPIVKQNICERCHFACSQCEKQNKNCMNCIKGSLLLKIDSNGAHSTNVCPMLCPSGFFSSTDPLTNTLKCKICVAPCATCQSQAFCLSCNSTSYLSGSTCVNSCPNNTVYPDNTKRECVACKPPCSQCTSATDCLKCTTGYLDPATSRCTLQCNSTSFISTDFVCTDCSSPCAECYTSSNCTKCQLPLIILNGNCITQSACTTQAIQNQVGKYALHVRNPDTNASMYGSCQSCTFPCQKCSLSSILCLTCVSDYILVQQLKTCVSQCPNSYFVQTKTVNSVSQQVCSICGSNCLECTLTSTNCTKCSAGMYLHPKSSSSSEYMCLQSCPDGYYGGTQFGNGGKCFICQSPCMNCYNNYLCKSCIVGKLLYNKNCIDSCPQGTAADSLVKPTLCTSCATGCSICVNVTTNCSACLSGYYYVATNNSCISTCPSTTFANQITQQCQQCINPCLQCTSVSQCSKCIANYFLQTFSFTCLTVCPDGTFANTSSQKCQQCNLTICQTCQNSQNACLTCAVNFFFDSNSKSCVNTCSPTQYPDIFTGTCKSCPFPCKTCKAVDFCQSCETNYQLFLDRCYSQCPLGYFAKTVGSSSSCEQCATSCQICTSLTNCQKCVTTYYVHNGLCVQTCPSGTYQTIQALTNYPICQNCFTNCLQCTNAFTCTLCEQGRHLFNGLCLNNCPILHFQKSFSKNGKQYSRCNPCSRYCNQCTNQTYCTQCLNTLIYNNQCYMECPQTTYSFNNQQCLDCVSPCRTCTSEFSCVTCVSGFIFFYEACLTTCPNDVWLFQSLNKCQSTCDGVEYNKLDTSLLTGRGNIGTSMYPHNKICYPPGQACGTPRLLVNNNNYCLQNCPADHYVSSNYQCTSCENNPDICSNLFIGDLKVIRSNALTLIVYFSQESQLISSIDQLQIQFSNVDNQVLNFTIQAYQITNFFVKLVYGFDQISLVTVTVILPYVKSLQTDQCINKNVFTAQIYYYRNYQTYIGGALNTTPATARLMSTVRSQEYPSQANGLNYQQKENIDVSVRALQNYSNTSNSITFSSQAFIQNPAFSYSGQSIVNIIAIISISLLFVSIVINVIVLESHFLQLMDFCQLIALTLYLEIQYPPILQGLLYQFGISLLNFLPGIDSSQVLKFSQSKFIYYHNDSSVAREVFLVLIFIIVLVAFLTVLVIDHGRKNWCLSKQQEQVRQKERERSMAKRKSSKRMMQQQLNGQQDDPKQNQIKGKTIKTIKDIIREQQEGSLPKVSNNRQQEEGFQVIAIGDKDDNIHQYIVKKGGDIQDSNQDQFYHHRQHDQSQDSQHDQNIKRNSLAQLKDIQKAQEQQKKGPLTASSAVPESASSPFALLMAAGNQKENNGVQIQKGNQNDQIPIAWQNQKNEETSKCDSVMDKLVSRIRFRHLNDLYGLFLSPLLLFAFSLQNSSIVQMLMSVVLIGCCAVFIGVICYKIINMKKLSELAGLMSELQPTEHVVGLMYTPFSHIRRFILCLIIGIQPDKPLSALTLLLVFTILILVCLVFYQPFLNQYTDYIAIATEIILSLYVILIMLIGLNVMDTSITWIFGIVAVSAALIGLLMGISWLIWLTILAIRQNFCLNKEQVIANQLTGLMILGGDAIKTREIAVTPKNNQQQQECSANNLIINGPSCQVAKSSRKKNRVNNQYYEDEDIYSDNQKEQFKHYGEDSSQEPSQEQNRPPELLIKMTTQL